MGFYSDVFGDKKIRGLDFGIIEIVRFFGVCGIIYKIYLVLWVGSLFCNLLCWC